MIRKTYKSYGANTGMGIILLILGLMISISCGTDKKNNDPVPNISGTWRITENVDERDCDEGFAIYEYDIEMTQNGNALTLVTPSGTFYGTIDGNKVSWSGSYDEDGGTVTIESLSLTVSSDGKSLSGESSWSWSDGFDPCSGTTDFTGTLTYSASSGGGGSEEGEDGGGSEEEAGGGGSAADPLSFFEEQVVGKWSRYHAYDDSTMYYIFNGDRSACYFEYTSTSSRRDEKTYVKWELNEASPVGTNVYKIVFTYSSGGTTDGNEFHYLTDEIWKGGYDNLVMTPSSTSRDCS